MKRPIATFKTDLMPSYEFLIMAWPLKEMHTGKEEHSVRVLRVGNVRFQEWGAKAVYISIQFDKEGNLLKYPYRWTLVKLKTPKTPIS